MATTIAGLVWWMIHAKHVAKRTAPLTIVGPAGVEARFTTAAEALFPGSTGVQRSFELRFQELARGQPIDIAGVRVTPFEVSHPSGAPSYALRFEVGGKVLAFSGDSEWVDSLVDAGQDADLFIMECYQFDGVPRFHMSWTKIAAQLDRIGARRVLLTHMATGMLDRRARGPRPALRAGRGRTRARRMSRLGAAARGPAARDPRLPHLPRCAAPDVRCRTSRAPCCGRARPRGSASAARRRARACMPRARRSPIRPGIGCAPGWR